MESTGVMPGPCLLCGAAEGIRRDGRWWCAVCGWRVGDVPDDDLPRPVIEVVYYVRYAERIKIGTSRRPRQRLAAIRHEQLLAFERGGRSLEQSRHAEFASLREGGEWFTAAEPLLAHIATIAAARSPWEDYARWTAEALQSR